MRQKHKDHSLSSFVCQVIKDVDFVTQAAPDKPEADIVSIRPNGFKVCCQIHNYCFMAENVANLMNQSASGETKCQQMAKCM